MSGLPQHLVDSREGRCICKGRSTAITVGYWAADIRTLATKCCYEVTGGEHRVLARAYQKNASQVWQEACMNPEIVGCSSA